MQSEVRSAGGHAAWPAGRATVATWVMKMRRASVPSPLLLHRADRHAVAPERVATRASAPGPVGDLEARVVRENELIEMGRMRLRAKAPNRRAWVPCRALPAASMTSPSTALAVGEPAGAAAVAF